MSAAPAPPLPHNIEVEQALLAALFQTGAAYDAAAGILAPEHFFFPLHGRIYEALGRMIERGEKPSPVALRDAFAGDPAYAEAGGAGYLVAITQALVTSRNAGHYARQIRDLWQRRRLIQACEAAIAGALQGSVEPRAAALIGAAEAALSDITAAAAEGAAAIDAGSAAAAAIAEAEAAYRGEGRLTGVTTGLADLDRILGGLQAGHLDILAGRPSMGKTLLADSMALAAARSFARQGEGRAVLIFSLEMSATELATRRLAARTGIAIERLRRGALTAADFAVLEAARQELAALPLLTDDAAGLSLGEIRARARLQARRRPGLGLVVVDHLGLIEASGEARRQGETAALTEISKGLKRLARELQVPVLALSQLNREVERRDDKRPLLADLRQSGSIEQDADVVMLIYREEYYLSRSEPAQRAEETEANFAKRTAEWSARLKACRNTVDILIAKHRNGAIGTVHAYFDGAHGRFANLKEETGS